MVKFYGRRRYSRFKRRRFPARRFGFRRLRPTRRPFSRRGAKTYKRKRISKDRLPHIFKLPFYMKGICSRAAALHDGAGMPVNGAEPWREGADYCWGGCPLTFNAPTVPNIANPINFIDWDPTNAGAGGRAPAPQIGSLSVYYTTFVYPGSGQLDPQRNSFAMVNSGMILQHMRTSLNTFGHVPGNMAIGAGVHAGGGQRDFWSTMVKLLGVKVQVMWDTKTFNQPIFVCIYNIQDKSCKYYNATRKIKMFFKPKKIGNQAAYRGLAAAGVMMAPCGMPLAVRDFPTTWEIPWIHIMGCCGLGTNEIQVKVTCILKPKRMVPPGRNLN